MTAIFLREFHSYFISPVGYVYLAAFYILAGYQFAVMILSGQADISAEFSFLYTVILLLTPILTMRLMSEDRKQKTDPILFSAPVTLNGIVAGKYFAAVVVYVIGVLVTLVHAVAISPYAEINWMIFWGNMAGIIFTGMAGIALCMFISSQTENQIIAAIGGFAAMILVISLNSIAGIISIEPLKKLLYGVSFYSRYYNMTMGIFSVSDIFFFVSFAAVFFFLTTRVLEKRRWGGNVRYGALATVITVLGIVLVIAANVTAGQLTEKFGLSVDLTADKRYAISKDTIEYIKKLDKEVKITVLVDEESMASGSNYIVQAYQNLLQYRRHSDKIKLEFVDLIDNPTFVSKYEDLELGSYDIIVEQGERKEVLSFGELYGYDESGSRIVSSKVDQMVTNALVMVTSDEKSVVSVLTGYGDVKPEDLSDLLVSNRFEVQEQSLLTEEINPDATTAVLYGPQSDLNEGSIEKLSKWLDNDGEQGKNLMVFLDPNVTELPNLTELLEEWGIALLDGYAFEANSNLYYEQAFYPIAQYANMDYASDMKQNDLTIMALCRPVDVLFEEKDNYKTSVLLQFSPYSGTMELGQTKLSKEDVTGDVKGMVLSTHSYYGSDVTSSNIIVSGSALAFSGSLVSGSTFANADYILGVFKKISSMEAGLNIVPKNLSVPTHTMTGARTSGYVWTFMVGLPVVVLIFAAFVWIRRRHR